MIEQNTIPTGILDAATDAMVRLQADYASGGECIATYRLVEATFEAAGVSNLVARIAELEEALRSRICEGCDKLLANVGQLHLCSCQDQRNLCGACKAGCACAREVSEWTIGKRLTLKYHRWARLCWSG